MVKVNKTLEYNDCNITIRFTPADKYGVDRHYIYIDKSMCKPFKSQCFKETEEAITDYAKQLTALVNTTCG